MYSKELSEKVYNEYLNSSITRKDIVEKYNIPFETFKGWSKRYYASGHNIKGIHYIQRQDYEIINILSSKFTVFDLCNIMNINRSGYYKWINRNIKPSLQKARRALTMALFKRYH